MTCLSFLPSIIWLCFFLKFDQHPEPKNYIARVFLWGMLVAALAFYSEPIFFDLVKYGMLISGIVLNWTAMGVIIVAPFIEEILKYGAAKIGYWEFPSEFDEPVDFMIYLITAALGFAAIENVKYVLAFVNQGGLLGGIILLLGRFLMSTFLHALTAAIIGFFVAISWEHRRQRLSWLTMGLVLAISIHSAYNYYNFYFIQGGSNIAGLGIIAKMGLSIGLLTILLALVIYLFKKLSKVKSICIFKGKINKLKVRKIYD